jgi:hypothetical protein
MSRNNIILAAVGGAIAGVVVANFLGTEKGKKTLEGASGLFKDLIGKATAYAKDTLENARTAAEEHQA